MQSTIVDIKSQYDSAGVDKATDGISKFGKSIDETSSSAEGLFRRLERPLGVIAFSGIADQVTDMGTKGESAGVMIEHGLHVAGAAITYFNPLVGFSIIALTALYEVFQKVGESSKVSADAIEKQAETLLKEKENIELAIETGQKYKNLNSETKAALQERLTVINASIEVNQRNIGILENVTTQREKEIESLKASNAAMEEHKNAVRNGYNAEAEMAKLLQSDQYTKYLNDLKKVDVLTKQQADDQARLNGLLAATPKQEQNKQDLAWINEKVQAQEKLSVATMKLSDIQNQVSERQKQIDVLEEQETKATTQKEVEEIQKRIQALQQLQQIDNQAAEKQKENAQKLQEVYKQQAREIEKTQNQISNIFQYSHGQIQIELGKFADQVIKSTAQMLSQQLDLQAMKDLANPLTVPIGIAELAAATAISAAGGIGGAAANQALSPSSSGSLGSGSSSSTQTQPGSSLTINVQGDVLGDDAYLSKLATKLNQAVLYNNIQLSSTTVNQGGAATAPAPSTY